MVVQGTLTLGTRVPCHVLAMAPCVIVGFPLGTPVLAPSPQSKNTVKLIRVTKLPIGVCR